MKSGHCKQDQVVEMCTRQHGIVCAKVQANGAHRKQTEDVGKDIEMAAIITAVVLVLVWSHTKYRPLYLYTQLKWTPPCQHS